MDEWKRTRDTMSRAYSSPRGRGFPGHLPRYAQTSAPSNQKTTINPSFFTCTVCLVSIGVARMADETGPIPTPLGVDQSLI